MADKVNTGNNEANGTSQTTHKSAQSGNTSTSSASPSKIDTAEATPAASNSTDALDQTSDADSEGGCSPCSRDVSHPAHLGPVELSFIVRLIGIEEFTRHRLHVSKTCKMYDILHHSVYLGNPNEPVTMWLKTGPNKLSDTEEGHKVELSDTPSTLGMVNGDVLEIHLEASMRGDYLFASDSEENSEAD